MITKSNSYLFFSTEKQYNVNLHLGFLFREAGSTGDMHHIMRDACKYACTHACTYCILQYYHLRKP